MEHIGVNVAASQPSTGESDEMIRPQPISIPQITNFFNPSSMNPAMHPMFNMNLFLFQQLYQNSTSTSFTPPTAPQINNPYYPMSFPNLPPLQSAFRPTFPMLPDPQGAPPSIVPSTQAVHGSEDRDSGNETSSLSPSHTPLSASPAHSFPSR